MRTQERVDLCGTKFVQPERLLIEALTCRPTGVSQKSTTKSSKRSGRTLWAASVWHFYCVIAFLCRSTTRQRLWPGTNTKRIAAKLYRKDQHALIMLVTTTLSLSAVADVPTPPKAAICASCHGVAGAAPILDTYPKLNGQNKGYLLGALKAYKNGERKGAMAAVMQGQAAMLSEQEMAELANYYAAQKPK
jgi:cytochrome c553